MAARLTAWYAGTAFLLVAGAGWAQYRTLDRDLAAEDDRLLIETLAATRRGPVPNGIPAVVGPQDAELGPLVRMLGADCGIVRGAWPRETPAPACPPAASQADDDARTTGHAVLRSWQSPAGRMWRIATGPADAAGERIEVALDRWTDARILANYRQQLTAVLTVALVLSSGLGYLFARRGLAPLVALGRRMRAVDARSLDQRIAPIADAPAEVQTLVASFDAMLARLEGAFTALSHFSAELAHEFRTPLHILRQQAEVALAQPRAPEAYRDVLGSGLEEIERLRRLVDDTLFLARAEDPRATITRTRLEVAAELHSVAEYLEAFAAESEVVLTTTAPDQLTVAADRTLFRRALVNLVTNAVRHTPVGGQVALAAWATDAGVAVAVRDTGEGMRAETVAHVFERFYRAPGTEARGDGAGLGLAIVRGVMQLHGGSAVAESTPGAGTRVILCFPAVPD